LALFEARPPIPYLPPPTDLLIDKREKGKCTTITGIGEYVGLFEDPMDTPPKPIIETKAEKKERRRREKEELLAYKNYETSENRLKRDSDLFRFQLAMIHDLNGKPRGYAFIEYSDKAEMSNAYKRADGTKVDGRRLIVDYERGRTQKSWLPRRLGGGKGDTRRARESRAAIEEREAAGLPPLDVPRDRDRDSPRAPPRDSHRDYDRNGSSKHRSRSRDRANNRISDRGNDRYDRDRGYGRDRRDNGYGRDDRRFRGPPPPYGGRDRR
uniref:U1 small nuclear ribonucleoprotein 70 kDa n=1 Tax=Angiostrongylus cantonensis TaxID=6313 RepID=A0A158P6B4_ANGCA